MVRIETVNDRLLADLNSNEKLQKKSVFLEQHPEYPTHFLVNSFDPLYPHKLKNIIGPYRAISMFKLDYLMQEIEAEGYDQVIFLDDPQPVFDRIESLNKPYPYDLGGIKLRPFQTQGFNFLRDSLSDIINWSTGAGKSVYAIAKAKYLLEQDKIDRIVVVSKNHNKINWQRSFKDIGGLDSIIVEAHSGDTIERRLSRKAQYDSSQIMIINYEKFRMRGKPAKGQTRQSSGDGEELVAALKDQRVYFIWDEMPTKLKNSATAVYKGATKSVKISKVAYQSMLSATPIDNAPEDIYACCKILSLKLDRKVFTTKAEFRQTYAKTMNPWARWQVATWDMEKLHEMGMRLAHMTHQADKYRDPDIRSQFPKEQWEDIIIDMSDEDRRLYQKVEKKIIEEFDVQDEVLSKLLVLQLICNNPASLTLAQGDLAKAVVEKYKPTGHYSAKLDTLHDLLDQVTGKVVLFTMYNDLGAKLLKEYIGDWGYTNVMFDGNARKKQEALDTFKNDRRIKVFISSDQGSDSINLQEASTVINYDLPWKHSTLIQRVNRINRITSDAEWVFYFNLIMANTMEERKVKILTHKRSWQDAVFNGEISQQAEDIGRISQADLIYMLTGE